VLDFQRRVTFATPLLLVHSLDRMCDKTRFLTVLAGAIGGAVAIAVMEAFSIRAAFPLAAIPFATSIVTVLGSPDAEPAQPRALIGGHLVSTVVGLLIVQLFGPGPWMAALAVGLAMVAMRLTRTFHPPAGIDPLVVVIHDVSWGFLIVPVVIGVTSLALFAFVWHNLVTRATSKDNTWPVSWW
jgi:CBS-domain-containing membrane protein